MIGFPYSACVLVLGSGSCLETRPSQSIHSQSMYSQPIDRQSMHSVDRAVLSPLV